MPLPEKLKAAFRSSSRKRETDSGASSPSSPASPRVDRRGGSLDERRPRQSSDSYSGNLHQTGRSRPLSSAYGSHGMRNASGPQSAVVDYAQPRHADPANESIANDYRAYLPVLSPVDDSRDEPNMLLGGNGRHVAGGRDGLHEEDVAHRSSDQRRTSLDVSKRKPLPATPSMSIDQSTVLHEADSAMLAKNYLNGFAAHDAADQAPHHKSSTGAGSLGSSTSSSSSDGTGRYAAGRDVNPMHEKTHQHNHGIPLRPAREEPRVGWSIRKPRDSESEDEALRALPAHSQPSTAVRDRPEEIERQIEQLLDGVVDLRNTVDEDKEVQWAPTVVHEVVKPHEHEIIQHKIFREIHNYEYHYSIQPVYDIEVLPPRHWIPNPDGQGLIEISADELPMQTGRNRQWKIVHEQVEPISTVTTKWRTEPKIIEHPTTISEEGFERKETTIIYPPTLQDMTDYEGLVQPVHFDHKTGERWLGEITTMHKLRKELGQVADPDSLTLNGLADSLPEVPEVSEVPELSQSPGLKRKPVSGPVPTQMGVAL